MNRGQTYARCKNTNDPYKADCVGDATKPGHYKSASWSAGSGGTPIFDGRIYLGNHMTSCATYPTCYHYWGQRTFRLDSEFYPKTTQNGQPITDFNYVRPRWTIGASNGPQWTTGCGNGGLCSTSAGVTSILRYTQAGTAKLNGRVYAIGSTLAPSGHAYFSIFGSQPGQSAYMSTSTGVKTTSFYVGINNANGYYNTRAIYAATYTLSVRDNAFKNPDGTTIKRTCVRKGTSIVNFGDIIDIHFDRTGWGQGMITPLGNPCPASAA